MKSEQSIAGWAALAEYMTTESEELNRVVHHASIKNKWLTKENIRQSLNSISKEFLEAGKLTRWLIHYPAIANERPVRTVGVVAAGNIPLVAFHDILSVLICGHDLQLKLSDKADVMLPFLLDKLCDFEPAFKDKIKIVDRLKDFDAVIATGSNNSARYFEYYFNNVPSIIRKNRNSVAILTGEESGADLKALSHDVFDYFGLGCRNVSKLFVPGGYDFSMLIGAFMDFSGLSDHNKYRNNLDYNRTLLLMNSIPFHDIDHINITENPMVASPIANLHYGIYTDLESVRQEIADIRGQLQCIVGNVEGLCTIPFGQSQQPGLMDYADEIDTLEFLLGI